MKEDPPASNFLIENTLILSNISDVVERKMFLGIGVINKSVPIQVGKVDSLLVEIADKSGSILLVFIGRPDLKGFSEGTSVRVKGVANSRLPTSLPGEFKLGHNGQKHLIIWNPAYEFVVN